LVDWFYLFLWVSFENIVCFFWLKCQTQKVLDFVTFVEGPENMQKKICFQQMLSLSLLSKQKKQLREGNKKTYLTSSLGFWDLVFFLFEVQKETKTKRNMLFLHCFSF
jgi:elongation factor P--beta-lysine ligase